MSNRFNSKQYINDSRYEQVVFRDCTIDESRIDGVNIFKLKSGKFVLKTSDIIDVQINHDDLKKEIFLKESLPKNKIKLKKGQIFNQIIVSTENQHYTMYAEIPKKNQNEILVFHTYSWNWNGLEQYFVSKDKFKISSSADLDFIIGGLLSPIVNWGKWTVIDHETAEYSMILTCPGFDRDISQKWLDVSTGSKVQILSVKQEKHSTGMSYDNYQKYTITVKVKNVKSNTITLPDLISQTAKDFNFIKGFIHESNLYLIPEFFGNSFDEKNIFFVFRLKNNTIVELKNRPSYKYESEKLTQFIGHTLIKENKK